MFITLIPLCTLVVLPLKLLGVGVGCNDGAMVWRMLNRDGRVGGEV
jgi:hypothetical protein